MRKFLLAEMEKSMVPQIVDDLVTKCMMLFLDSGYIVQIYPQDNSKYAVMCMKIGVQGGHYVSENLEDAFVSLLRHMKNIDKSLSNDI